MTSSHIIVSDPFTITLIRIKARQLCRRSDFSRSDYDDLRQEMRLYLLEKVSLFDPSRGRREAFVTRCLNTWVTMQLRYRGRQKRRASYQAVSLEGTPVACEGDVTSLGAILLKEDGQRRVQVYPVSPTEQFELREALDHVMEKLAPADRELLSQVAEDGLARTARERRVSRRQIKNALDRLRPYFEEAGLGHK